MRNCILAILSVFLVLVAIGWFFIKSWLNERNLILNFKTDTIVMYKGYNFTGKFLYNVKDNMHMYFGTANAFQTTFDMGIYSVGGNVDFVISGQCHRTDLVPIDKLFKWMPLGKYIGKSKYLGQECSMYSSAYIRPLIKLFTGKDLTLYACVRDDKMPVYLAFQVGDNPKEYEFEFVNQTTGIFEVTIDPICKLPLNVCKAQEPAVQSWSMTRFHEIDKIYSIEDENLGSMMGDVYFGCVSKLQGAEEEEKGGKPPKDNEDQLVSTYKIMVNTSWGQYALCNYKQCMGGLKGTVGREQAIGNAIWGGQCDENKNQGNWFSILSRDQCKKDQKVGDDGCAWKLIEVVKTIEYKCLKGHGFEESCIKDGKAPFTKSLEIFEKTFSSVDVNDGGCPDVQHQYK